MTIASTRKTRLGCHGLNVLRVLITAIIIVLCIWYVWRNDRFQTMLDTCTSKYSYFLWSSSDRTQANILVVSQMNGVSTSPVARNSATAKRSVPGKPGGASSAESKHIEPRGLNSLSAPFSVSMSDRPALNTTMLYYTPLVLPYYIVVLGVYFTERRRHGRSGWVGNAPLPRRGGGGGGG